MTTPKRKGLYWVTYVTGPEGIARWDSPSKNLPPQWFALSDPADLTLPKIETPVNSEDITSFRAPTKDELHDATFVEQTRDQKIDESRAFYDSLNYEQPVIKPGRPEFVPVEGDALEVGNLQSAIAEKIWDCPGGPLVTFSCDELKSGNKGMQSGRPMRVFKTMHYTDVFIASKICKTTLVQDSVLAGLTPINSNIAAIADRCLSGRATTETAYQRDYVWSESDAQNFLDSLFQGKPLGLYVFLRRPFPLVEEVLDGKQRITTFMKLVNNEIPYQGYYWSQMSRMDRYRVSDRNASLLELDAQRYKPSDLLKIFLDINAAGVPQTKEHLAKVQALYELELQKERS